MNATWFTPICDDVLLKIYKWWKFYDLGLEAATRKKMGIDSRIVDVVTKRAHKLQFKNVELEHLIRLMKETKVNEILVSDFERVKVGLKNGRLLPGGFYKVELAFYREDLEEILLGLLKAKTGKVTIEEVAEEQRKAGKDLFEL